jgi:hypothetical protein
MPPIKWIARSSSNLAGTNLEHLIFSEDNFSSHLMDLLKTYASVVSEESSDEECENQRVRLREAMDIKLISLLLLHLARR